MRTQEYIGNDIAQKTASWLLEIRSKVAPHPNLVPDPTRAALLIIDMQRYFAHPCGRCFLDSCPAIVPRIQLLLGAWRAHSGTVVFTRHGHTGQGDLGMLGRFFSDYIEDGEESSEIIEALSPLPEETVIKKKTYDAFLNTPLESCLRDRGIEQVVIAGVLTHMCLETSARSAFCRGFEVYLPVDAAASSREDLHFNSLLALADAAAIPTSVDEVLNTWNKKTSS